MIDGKTILGIIPARGGSKRLPGKNLAILSGRPLIAYTIEAGLKSSFIDELVLSTDDEKIAKAAIVCGARVPFFRPSILATDTAGSFDVLKHAIDYYQHKEQRVFDFVVCLQPTSPLRDNIDIDRALRFLCEKSADAVISVCEAEHSPMWANTLPRDMAMDTFLSDAVKSKRSQDLDKYYRLNGAIYICNIKKMIAQKTRFLKKNIYAFIMPQEKSVDIDTWLDLKVCQMLMDIENKKKCAHTSHQPTV